MGIETILLYFSTWGSLSAKIFTVWRINWYNYIIFKHREHVCLEAECSTDNENYGGSLMVHQNQELWAVLLIVNRYDLS